MSKSRKKSSNKLKRDSLNANDYRGFSQNPPQLKLWMSQGEKQLDIGNYLHAIALFDKVIEVNSNYWEVWYNRGVALDNLGELEEALVSYNKAIEIEPNFYLAWNNQGNVLHELGKLEQALASYNKAIEIRPQFYGAWYNQGNVLNQLGKSEQALASYNKALEIKPDFYLGWYNYGNKLHELGRFEQALASYNKVLEIKPQYYQAWSKRGIALRELRKFEQALESYDKAIEIQPELYEALNNKGLLLNRLGRLEQALASYKKAIEIEPESYEALNNQGEVLIKMGRLEQALASYDKALEIQPNLDLIFYNRGTALCMLGRFEEALASYDKAIEIQPNFYQVLSNRGIVLDSLGRFEEAIASCNKAIEIQPDYYQAWNNRGVAAGYSVSYDPLLASQSTIAKQNPELNKRGYEGKLVTYHEGLKHCLQQIHPQGWGKLHQAIGNAHYSQARKVSHPRDYWKQAANSYNQALKTLTATDFPELHLEVLQDLIPVRFDLGDIAKATELQRQGTDLLRDLLNKSQSSAKKQQLNSKFAGFQQFTVDLAVQSGNLVQALECAEAGKNACLSWILGDESEVSPTWEEMKQLVKNYSAIVYWHLSPAALHTFILKPDSPLPISDNKCRDVAVQRLHKFENWVKDWNEKYANYRKGKDDNSRDEIKDWRNNLPELLEELAKILDIPTIVSQITNNSIQNLKSKIQNLILVPHRDLHRFPLHALFPDNFTITYLPSAKIALNQSKLPKWNHTYNDSTVKFLSVEYPSSSGLDLLEFAEVESEVITRMFPNCRRIPSEEATQNAVESALPNNYNIFHFTGHGEYNFHNPASSDLKLAEKDKITLENICKFDLSSYQLVTLAACETAITGNNTITSEYVGLTSGFIGCGVSHVVSTLWTVESAASALVMIEFYQGLQQGKTEAVALREATNWLRNITVDELAKWYTEQIAKLPENQSIIRRFLQSEATNLTNKLKISKTPYSHPYYWAAFTITGNL